MITLNEYFEGGVKSLGYQNGGKSTVGVIDVGEYEFGTTTHEIMFVVDGVLEVLLPNATEWKPYGAGEQFEVEANTSFSVKVTAPAAYHCKYGI